MQVSVTKQFVWKIQDFPRLGCTKLYSDTFSAGGFQWCLLVCPEGNNANHLSLYLATAESLSDWCSIRAEVFLSVVDQIDERRSIRMEAYFLFNSRRTYLGSSYYMPLHDLCDPDYGYLEKDTLTIVAKVTVLDVQFQTNVCTTEIEDSGAHFEEYCSEWTTKWFNMVNDEAVHMVVEGFEDDGAISEVVGVMAADEKEGQEVVLHSKEVSKSAELDVLKQVVSDEKSHCAEPINNSEEAKEDQEESGSDFLGLTALVSDTEPQESELLNGFSVPISQMKERKDIFEKYPDFASNFRPENEFIRKAYMEIFLGIIKTLGRSPGELSEHEIGEVLSDLIDLEVSGFKIDWLKPKVEEAAKRRERVFKSRVDELNEQLEKMKMVVSDLEAQLEKEKAETTASAVPLSFKDLLD